MSLKLDALGQKFDDLEKEGFTRSQLLKMSVYFPPFLSTALINIQNRILKFIGLDYSREQVIAMMVSYPQIVSIDLEQLMAKYTAFLDAGFSKEEIVHITVSYPTIFGNSLSTLNKKLATVFEKGLKSEIMENPKRLMQSAKMTAARANFYEKNKEGLYQSRSSVIYCNFNYFNKKISPLSKTELIKQYGDEEKKIA